MANYDVFLSFRGEDTRRTFTDHLYTALCDAGLQTFRDSESIWRGENVDSELEKAIKAAGSSIIVISQDYASSSSCLDELVMILENKRTSGHVVVPVFYHVVPSNVRHQRESFAESFARHGESEKVEGWRNALREVANIAGIVIDANGFKSILIKKIVNEIGDKLNRPFLHVAPYLIGMESRVRNISQWLWDQSAIDGIVVICGIGGIGKTTIAKYVYNLHFKRFDSSSFLANIRETSEQHNGLVGLQRQLLSDILKRDEKNTSNVDEGIVRIEHALGCKKVLLVLDDVDQRDQLDSIIGMHKRFHLGSKIVVTTRNKNILRGNEVYKIYDVKNFNDEHSLELFSWHAFGQDHPKDEYYQHSENVARRCGGLPLALKVLGSSLFGQSIDIWESTLKKLEVIPDSQILKKLKISYDSLEDDSTRKLFLYIAGFFIGEGKDFAVKILDRCGFYTVAEMRNIIDRCLLTIDGLGKLHMHQVLQDMAREILRQESPHKPGERSMLLHHEDSFNVLSGKTGTKTIEGLSLDMHVLENSGLFNRTFGIRDIKRPRFEEDNGMLLLADQGNSLKRRCLSVIRWLPIKNAAISSNQVELEVDAFAGMPSLRLLKLNSVEIKGSFQDFPKELRWVSWHRCPLNSIPIYFPLQSLIALDLSHSRLEHFWKGAKLLKALKNLNLSHCHGLTNTPDFTGLTSLEDLILEYCINLVEVHKSIGGLKELVSLNLRGCENLKQLPSEIHCLTSLRKLDISGCSKLDLSAEEGRMNSLIVHQGDGITINRASTTFGVESWSGLLKPFELKPRKSPESIYFSLANLPHSLVTLNLGKCNLSNDDLARSLGSLSLLQDLNLEETPIYSLPESIKYLMQLKALKLANCDRLQCLPELPMSLTYLNLSFCTSLETVRNIPNLFTCLELLVWSCALVEVPGLWKVEPIGNATLEIIENFGLSDHLESMRSQKVTLLNHFTNKTMKLPVQGVSECGIYNLFLPRSLVPCWCSNYKTSGDIIEFNVPSYPNLKIRILKVHVMYAYASEGVPGICGDDCILIRIRIRNESKGLVWIYWPTWECVLDGTEDWVWLSHWKIGHQFLMEPGDEIRVSAFIGSPCQIKEVGVDIEWDEDKEGGCQHHNTYPSLNHVVDLTPYLIGPGEYFLCHHCRELYQAYNKLQGKAQQQQEEEKKILLSH